MPTMELSDREYQAVQRMRMTVEQRKAEISQLQAAHRQLRLLRMTPQQKAEQERLDAMPQAQRKVYFLRQRKAAIEAELEKLENDSNR